MNKIEFGDCRDTMRRWAADGVRVQTCVTSPPYFGLRDYGHEGQIGLEQTPEQYIAAMVEVFRCVRDVLADDGTLWVNIGDSYAGGGGGNYSKGTRNNSGQNITNVRNRPDWLESTGLKPKDLIGIPWMLAFALRADGWYLRQDIIWHKPNPMPESVRDRCTKAHEYVFLLSKSERYFFDSKAIKESAIHSNRTAGNKNPQKGTGVSGMEIRGGLLAAQQKIYETRNRRSVWTVATRPYKGAHFATFPPALIEPCILAGSLPVGAYEPDDLILSTAGEGERENDPSMTVGRAGWSRPRRAVEAIRPMSRAEQAAYAEQLRNSPHREAMMREAGGESTFAHYTRTDRSGARAVPPALFDRWVDLGWLNRVAISPRLAEPHRSVVLDPFMGSGTTAAVALQHGRQYLGCELNPEYGPLQDQRIASAVLSDLPTNGDLFDQMAA
jgi:DNA modification methylase